MRAERLPRLRPLAKRGLFYVAIVLTSPLWVPVRLERAWARGERWFAACSELLSLVPGVPGILLRRGFYRMTLEGCAEDCHIGFGTTVPHTRVSIGRGVYIGNRCTIGMVTIEDHVAIGSNVDVLSGRHHHNFGDPDRPILEQGGTFAMIRIGRNSWIGNGAIVMADIGPESVVGAGSVVVKPIPMRSVAVGNPATVKKPVSCGPTPDPTTRILEYPGPPQPAFAQ
jgi:acetyltransferase-like isoleucine patch superfamily enzyme